MWRFIAILLAALSLYLWLNPTIEIKYKTKEVVKIKTPSCPPIEPCVVEMKPADIVYVSPSCDPCRCDDESDDSDY
jgi:hypothetical protein